MKTHPTYPLQDEEKDAMIEAADKPEVSSVELAEIRKYWSKRRDEFFPGWREKYDAEFKVWLRGANANPEF